MAAVAVVVVSRPPLLWRYFPPRASRRMGLNCSASAGQICLEIRHKDFFAERCDEVLITDLGKIGSSRIISRPSVMKYKGWRAPLRQVAGELNDSLRHGAIFTTIASRITTQLYNAADDRQLSARKYERDMRDVIALQREVAHAITTAIAGQSNAGGNGAPDPDASGQSQSL